jgi:hypothetical protein
MPPSVARSLFESEAHPRERERIVNNCIPQKKPRRGGEETEMKCLYQLRKMCLERIFRENEGRSAAAAAAAWVKNTEKKSEEERGTLQLSNFHHLTDGPTVTLTEAPRPVIITICHLLPNAHTAPSAPI